MKQKDQEKAEALNSTVNVNEQMITYDCQSVILKASLRCLMF